MNTLKDDWESFDSQVIPDDAGTTQRQEMRRAFYAGAWSMLCAVERLGNEAVSEEQGVVALEKLKAECQAFVFLVKKGRL